MNTPTLGQACFASTKSHTTSDEVRIPERIESIEEACLRQELGEQQDIGRRLRARERSRDSFQLSLVARLLENRARAICGNRHLTGLR